MHLPLYATLTIIHIAMDDRLQGDLIHGLLIASFVMTVTAIVFWRIRDFEGIDNT